MTKTEFVAKLADRLDIPKTKAADFVNAFIDEVTEALKDGEKIQLTGFGIFKVNHRPARTGKVPNSNQVRKFPARNVPVFKAGKQLKDATN